MILNSDNKIVLKDWELIPMTYITIDNVNTLGNDQPKLLTFIDRRGCIIGGVETPVVGEDSD